VLYLIFEQCLPTFEQASSSAINLASKLLNFQNLISPFFQLSHFEPYIYVLPLNHAFLLARRELACLLLIEKN